jgi:hypothetical protein
MTAIASVGGPAKLDIMRVVQATFQGLGANLWLIPLALATQAPSAVVDFVMELQGATTSPLGNPLSNILSGLGGCVLQGALIASVSAKLEGRGPSIPEAIGVAQRKFLPLLGQSIVSGVGLVLAFLLFIVPGVILATAWSVCAPALVLEKLGMVAALRRSAQLTQGRRWRIFLLLLLVLAAMFLMAVLLGIVVVVSVLVFPRGEAAGIAITGLLISAVTYLVGGAGSTALYHELRFLKDGVGLADPGAVFD